MSKAECGLICTHYSCDECSVTEHYVVHRNVSLTRQPPEHQWHSLPGILGSKDGWFHSVECAQRFQERQRKQLWGES